MAEGYDGSIRINTPVDDSGINQGTSRISQAMRKVKSAVEQVGRANQDAFGPKQQKQIDTLTQRFERQKDAAAKAARSYEDLKRQYDAIVGGEKTPASLKAMESEFKNIQKEIAATEKQYAELESKMENLQQKAYFEKQLDGLVSPATAAEISNLETELDKAGIKLHDLDAQSKKVEESIGKIKLDPSQSIEAQKLSDQMKTAADNASRLQDEASVTAQRLGEASQQGSNLAQAPKRATRAMDLFGSATRKAGKEVQKTQNSTDGLTGSVGKLGKRLKSLAAAALVFNVIRKALRNLSSYLGDVIKTNDQFMASLAQIKGNLLTAFQPIWEAITPALNALAAVLAKVTGYIAALVSLLFGKAVSASQGAAKSLYDQAKAYGAAGKAADKAAGQLAAFDDINVLSQDDASSGGGGGSGIAPDFGYELDGLENLADLMRRIIDPILKAWAKYGNDFKKAWKRAFDEVKGAAVDMAKTFFKVWEEEGEGLASNILILLTTIGNIIADIAVAWRAAWDNKGEEFVRSFYNRLNALLKLVNSIGEAFREAWNQGIGQEIFENILEIITYINNAAAELTDRFREAWEENDNSVAIWTAILAIINDVLSAVNTMAAATVEWAQGLDLEPLVSGFRTLLEAIEPLVDNLAGGLAWAYKNVLLPFGSWLAELAVPAALSLLADAFDAINAAIEAVKPVAEWIWDSFLVPLGEWTGAIILDALDFLGKKFQQITDWIKANGEDIQIVLQTIGEVFSFIFEYQITNVLTNAWNTIKGVVDSILEIFGGLIIFLAGVFTNDWEKAWEGVKEIFSGIWNGMASVLEGILNAIINALNFFIQGINQISFDVPDWVPKIGGKKFGFDIPEIGNVSIPKLATGAVIPPNSEFLAVLGDQKSGRNFEAPESLIDEKLAPIYDILETLAESMQGSSRGGDIVVEMDGREVFRVVQNEARRRGKDLVKGGGLV